MNTSSEPHLRVEDISKSYGANEAVAGASLDVTRGQTMALLGPSGCGKTSLLRVIAGLERPDRGRVIVGGRNLNGVAAMHRRIGMVFQDGALFPHMTVGQNIGYGLERSSGNGRRIAAALDLVDLAGFQDRMPATLSGGEAQRVALARALAPEPEILLLDEPFASLDAELRIRVRAEVAALLRSVDITAVFVTHDQEEAFVVGDQVAVMRHGRILQVGTPAGLYDRPGSPWIATFVGDANLIDGLATGPTAETSVGHIPLADELHGPVRLVVRPEHIEVGSGDDGTVLAIEFYGHDTAYELTVDGSELTARGIAAPRFAVGDHVSVSYAGPRVVAFPSVRKDDLTASV